MQSDHRKSLRSLGHHVLGHALSYVVTPECMPALCAISRTIDAVASTAGAWRDTVVDTQRIKPKGAMARQHYACWSCARLVIGGRWQLSNVGLLRSTRFAVWTWLADSDGSPLFRLVSGKRVLLSQSPVPATSITMKFDVSGVVGHVHYGLIDTPDPLEIVAASQGEHSSRRGPGEPVDVGVDGCFSKLHRPGQIRDVLVFVAPPRLELGYAAVVFGQASRPEGTVSPCWTQRSAALT